MQLFTNCKYCHKEIKVKSHSNTRPELRQEIGETSSHRCTHCNQTSDRHVNQIKAKSNKTIVWLGIILGSLLCLVLILTIGLLAYASLSIPFYAYYAQQKSAKLFNAYSVTSYPK